MQAKLTPRSPVVVSGEAVELTLEVAVGEDTALDAAVLGGLHLDVAVGGASVGAIGGPAGRRVDVAGGTVIERTLQVTLPVESSGAMVQVSVAWPGLPGAAASLEVAPVQSTLDVAALDLARTRVLLVTSFGNMTLNMWPDKAPKHVANFLELCKSGFYDGTRFHRILKNFIVQGGCPNTKEGATDPPGTGGPGYAIDAELSDARHVRGVLSMARGADLDSAGSQFFLCHGDASSLDGKYSAFGRLESGFDTLDKIADVPVQRRGQSATPLAPVHLYKAVVLPVPK